MLLENYYSQTSLALLFLVQNLCGHTPVYSYSQRAENMEAKHKLHFEHLRILNVFLDKSLKDWIYIENRNAYYSLSELIVSKLIVFNRIRAGEASRVTDFDFLFSESVQHKQLPKRITENADKLTQAMKDEMYRMIFTTKYGRVSFVVLNTLMVKRIKDLIKMREPLNISMSSFLLCDPDFPEEPIKGSLALKKVAKCAVPEVPTHIFTASNIREHYRTFTKDCVSVRYWRATDKQYDTESDDE